MPFASSTCFLFSSGFSRKPSICFSPITNVISLFSRATRSPAERSNPCADTHAGTIVLTFTYSQPIALITDDIGTIEELT